MSLKFFVCSLSTDVYQAGTFPSRKVNDGSQVILTAGAGATDTGHANITHVCEGELWQNMGPNFRWYEKKHK